MVDLCHCMPVQAHRVRYTNSEPCYQLWALCDYDVSAWVRPWCRTSEVTLREAVHVGGRRHGGNLYTFLSILL